jgi:hypothetical protein
MHHSIDSALGRDIRLNRIGETINSIAVPAAAYSLRSLTGGDPEVVSVRRQGTGEENFTVSQINSGALVDYVNTNGVFANTGYESFSNASTSGFTASNTGSTGFAISDLPDGTSGTAISVSFDISITNGSPSISLRTALDGGSSASNSVNYTSSGSKTATLTATGNYVGVGFTEGDAPSNFTVSNFKILGNGFVTKWYDQSGNGNHCVQGSADNQPKIVSSGSLVSNGLDFDGTNDFLPIPLTGHNIGNLSSFCVGKFDSASGNSDMMLSLGTSTGNSRWYAPFGSSSNIRYGYGSSSSAIANFSASTDVKLHTIIAGTTIGNVSGFENGTLKGTATRVTTASSGTIGIGGIDSATDFPLNGKVQEVIVYESDQSSNRTRLETNIMNHYSIS